ncbi:hypothetical protein PAN31108_03638 [Pandoraea anhela]|uniref:IPT/TIG domain-containing protein n=2 Tax=Pandoraea anhela TaxID=2508295 RepID=A0A5E4X4T2_9BURK|nr:hypothetical protein PAN31108_03638 [Pandoraea anhela]
MATIIEIKFAEMPVGVEGGYHFKIIGTGLAKASEVYFVDAASKRISVYHFTVVDDATITSTTPELSKDGMATINVTVDKVDATPAKTPANLVRTGPDPNCPVALCKTVILGEYVNRIYVAHQNPSNYLWGVPKKTF